MRRRTVIAAAGLWALLLAPVSGNGSESCAMLSGTCRDACTSSEQAEAGAFEDCGERQECCIARSPQQARCCVRSISAAEHGTPNCSEPVNGACPLGSPSPVPCDKLPACAERK